MIGVNNGLIIHRRMDGRDDAAIHTKAIVQYLYYWHNTVSGARRIRDNRFQAIEYLVINAINNSCIDTSLGGLREQYALSPICYMLLGGRTVREATATFKNHINTLLAPRQFPQIFMINYLYSIAIYRQGLLI